MAAATVASSEVVVSGNKVAVLGKFVAISDTNTWAPGLSTIDGVFLTNGAHDIDLGCTISGGTVTFTIAGAMANAMVMAIGT